MEIKRPLGNLLQAHTCSAGLWPYEWRGMAEILEIIYEAHHKLLTVFRQKFGIRCFPCASRIAYGVGFLFISGTCPLAALEVDQLFILGFVDCEFYYSSGA